MFNQGIDIAKTVVEQIFRTIMLYISPDGIKRIRR